MHDDPAVTAAELHYVITLSMAPEDVQRLKRLNLLQGGRFATHRMTATYCDTPDLALKDRALALSVCQQGRHVVETLESFDALGAANGEKPVWQTPLTRPTPDLAPLAGVDALKGLVEARPHLRPIFTCRLRRSRMVVESDGAAVALSFDEGTIQTRDGKKLPMLEIELELKQGGHQAVFDLARALSQAATLRVELRSKAARGYALATRAKGGAPPVTERYGHVALDHRMPTEDALAAILRRCIAHMLANDQAARVGDKDGVHQMRVALRRLSVALNLFKDLLPAEQRQSAMGEVKYLAIRLGKARNWDVFADLVVRISRAFPEDADLKTLTRAIAHERRAAYTVLRKMLASRRYAQFTLGLMAAIETRVWRQPGKLQTSILQVSVLGGLADALIEKRYRKARKLAKEFDRLGTAMRHKLRIALKKMRYAADSFAAIYNEKRVRRYVKRLETLQHDLGLLNDIVTGERLIRALLRPRRKSAALKRAAAVVRGWCGHVAADCEPELDKLLKRFRKTEPFWRRPTKA